MILVFNHVGELALQLRAAIDDSYPHHWDFSAAGGIEAGETAYQAAHRELMEEIGIDGELTSLGEYHYTDNDCRDDLHIYKLIYDGPFHPDATEVERIQFFSLEVVQTMLKGEYDFHPEFRAVWNAGIIQ